MVIKTTLKENKEQDVDYVDVAYYCDENWIVVADLFEKSEQYYDRWGETDFDKLYQVFTERQVASACLKWLRSYAKEKDSPLMIWEKNFIDLDCDGEIAYGQLETLIEEGVITGSNQLEEIKDKAVRKGYFIRKGYWYGENDNYYGTHTIYDLVEEYFPCHAVRGVDYCDDCGNCQ